MIIELLTEEHRNIERLLAVLEHELDVFDSGDRPDYEVIRAIVSYFQVYPAQFHHPQEDLIFDRLKRRDPAATAKIGDLAGEHEKVANCLRRVANAIDAVLSDREMLRETVDVIIRDFIEQERRHLLMEDRYFFPAALKALKPQDWTDIAAAKRDKDPLFSEVTEQRFDVVRAHILQIEQEAEAERKGAQIKRWPT